MECSTSSQSGSRASSASIRSRGKLSDDDVNKALREVRLALLEADVNFKVVKDFTESLRERLEGAEISEALNPGQTVVKAVNDELTELMGGAGPRPRLRAERADRDPDGRAPGLGQDDRDAPSWRKLLREGQPPTSRSPPATCSAPRRSSSSQKLGEQAKVERLRAAGRDRRGQGRELGAGAGQEPRTATS